MSYFITVPILEVKAMNPNKEESNTTPSIEEGQSLKLAASPSA